MNNKFEEELMEHEINESKVSSTYEISYDYGPHMSKTVSVSANSEKEAEKEVIRTAAKEGHRNIMINWIRKDARQSTNAKKVNKSKEEIMEHEINESPFSGIANTLKKYGGKDNIKDEPKKVAPKRSAFHGDIAMTGHKEKINKDGSRSYSKVLPDHDDDADVKTVAAVQKDVAKQVGAEEPVKRGRGRPKGVGAKAGSYKPRDPAKKAASAAKAAATKAANKAKRAQLTKEDLDEFLEGFDFNGLVDFMLSEDVQSLGSDDKRLIAAYVREATDTEVRDPKTGKLISWKHVGDNKPARGTVTDKSGAKHTDMSRARDLARKAITKEKNEEVELEEANYRVHTKTADGRDGPKILINAVDDANAEFQANQKIGQKPYRGHSVAKIEKINKNVNESVSDMDRYKDAVGKGVFSKLAR